MANRNSVLLVSENPELHRVMEIITSTYNVRLMGTEVASEGIKLCCNKKPDCLIFDLDVMRDSRRRMAAKKRVEGSGVPVLFVNDQEGGSSHQSGVQRALKIEPIVKFVLSYCRNPRPAAKGGFVSQLRSLFGFRRVLT